MIDLKKSAYPYKDDASSHAPVRVFSGMTLDEYYFGCALQGAIAYGREGEEAVKVATEAVKAIGAEPKAKEAHSHGSNERGFSSGAGSHQSKSR